MGGKRIVRRIPESPCKKCPRRDGNCRCSVWRDWVRIIWPMVTEALKNGERRD